MIGISSGSSLFAKVPVMGKGLTRDIAFFQNISQKFKPSLISIIGERSGSLVECLTRDRGAAGSSLTGVTALWPLSKTR